MTKFGPNPSGDLMNLSSWPGTPNTKPVAIIILEFLLQDLADVVVVNDVVRH